MGLKRRWLYYIRMQQQ